MGKEEFITVKSDSIEKALTKAREMLNASADKIGYEVVAKEKHGFLFEKETVIINAWKKEADWEQLVEDALNQTVMKDTGADPVDGTIEISAGRVIIRSPQHGGKYPTIEAGKNTKVIINGETIAEAAIVTAEDNVQIEVLNQEPSINFDLEITDDKLNAFMVVTRKFGRVYRVKDCSPGLYLRTITETVEEVPPPKISPREVIQLLKDNGIVQGINEYALSELSENNAEGQQKVLVAAGRPPVASQNSNVEYVFLGKTLSDDSNKNPYQDIMRPSVDVGEVLAVKNPAVPGKEGVNLYGEVIVPDPPQDTEILFDEGVRLVKNDTEAVATFAGRPVLEGKILKVLPVYTVYGDVDINVGNINFKGDIQVQGSVLDGFRLTAGGDITVQGNVIQAELIAGGSINVYKNVISSELNAGGTALIYKRLLPEMQRVTSLIKNLLQAMQLLKTHSSFKVNDLQQGGEGRLIQLLVDTKFKLLPRTIEGLFDIIKTTKTALPPELKEVTDQLQKLTGLNPLRIEKRQEVFEVLRIVETFAKKIQENCEYIQPANITASYVQNTILKTSGDIIITGRGVITSDLLAGGNISVNSPNAVVRGGEIYAGGITKVNELGSNADVLCTVRINEGSVLEAQLVHPAVTLESGYGKYKFEDTSRSVKAYISTQGILEVEKLKAK